MADTNQASASVPEDVDADMPQAGAEGKDGDEEPTPENDAAEMVPAATQVNQELLGQLTDEMGFGRNRAVRALLCTASASLEAAAAWLADHEDDEDIDEELLVPKATPKKAMTEEERKEAAEELRRRIKERREEEEKKLELERERERIRVGKELSMAAKMEEEQRIKRNAEERVREKKEQHEAMESMRRQLEEDRKDRRRQLGLPEELTEEEQAAEAEKRRQKAEAEKKRMLSVRPVTAMETMRSCLVEMKKAHSNETDRFQRCCKTLMAYCRNVYTNPEDDQKRRINLSNKALMERVACVTNGIRFLTLVGFAPDDAAGALVMERSAVDRELLRAAGEVLDGAMTNPMFGML